MRLVEGPMHVRVGEAEKTMGVQGQISSTLVHTLMCRKAKNASIGQAEVTLVGVPMAGIVAAVIAFPYPSLSRVVI